MCISHTLEILRGAKFSGMDISEAIGEIQDISDPVVREYIVAHWGEVPNVLIDVSALPEGLPAPSCQYGLALDQTGVVPRIYVWCAQGTPRNIWDGTHRSVGELYGDEEARSLLDWIQENHEGLVEYANPEEGEYWEPPPEVQVLRKTGIDYYWSQSSAEEIADEIMVAQNLTEVLENANENCAGEWLVISDEEEVAERLETALQVLLERWEDLEELRGEIEEPEELEEIEGPEELEEIENEFDEIGAMIGNLRRVISSWEP